jgi:hypothetical protein
VKDHSLSVSPNHSVKLGLGVSVPNPKDSVTVKISGLPSYETITDNLDHKTFSGSSINLTAAEVNSGLRLSSHYQGSGNLTAKLTVTATDSAGTSTQQTITVNDPPKATTSSGTSTTTSGSGTSSGHHWHHHWSGHHDHAVAASSSGTSTTTSSTSSGQSRTSHTNVAQWFSDHPDFVHAATTLSEAGASRSGAASNVSTSTSSSSGGAGARYALLNQMMAGDFGGASHFASAATASSASSQQQANLLTRPLH